jgi:hypothetical protein
VATIVTRAGKGAALTHQEVDANFTGLNTELGQKEVASNKGVANGYASLDAAGKVPSAQLPSYVDDVVEVANFASLPGTGETGKIYVTIDTNKTYRWTGSTYIEISASPGSTDSLAEGSTNLYFTQARARSSVSASGSLSYNSSTGVMSFSDAVTSVAGRTGAVTLTSSDVGLGNVENKSSATIRGEITSSNVTTALGFTPYNATNPSGYISGNQTITVSGDASGSGATSIALTLANSGVSAGTYTKVTVDAKGRVTTGASLASGDLPTYTGTITSSQVTTALGYTPYNSSNPSGYQTAANVSAFFGSSTTSGTLDWNDVSNTKPGAYGTLLLGTATNGPGGGNYYHPVNFEYGSKDGTGNVTQIAVAYGTPANELWMRGRYVGTWASWVRFLNSSNYNEFAPTKTGGGASGTWGIRITGFANQGSPRLYSTDGTYNYDSGAPYYGYLTYNSTANRWRFKVSPATPDAVEVAYADASGSVSSITSGQVTTALGYTPYNSTNPNGYITSSALSSYLPLSGGTLTGSLNTQYVSVKAGAGIYLYRSDNTAYTNWDARADGNQAVPHKYTFHPTHGYGAYKENWWDGDSYHSLQVTSNVLQYDGSTVLHAGNYSGYALPLSGGTLTGTFTVNTNANQVAYFQSPNPNTWVDLISTAGTWSMGATSGNRWAIYNRTGTNGLRFEVDTSAAYVNSNVVLHAGNYSSYALPLSGGTITGTLNINGGGSQPLNLTTSSSSPWGFGLTRSDAGVSSKIFLHNGSGSWAWVYEHNPVFYNGGAYSQFLHSGNYTSYSPTLTGGGASGTWGINVTGASGSAPLLSALGLYVWSASTLPTGYNQGIQCSFVYGGWPSYGSVMTMNTYSGGGGALQLYVPYSPTYGGTGLQVRFGNYDVSSGNSWTSWKTLLASDNYSSYALPLSGGTMTGTIYSNASSLIIGQQGGSIRGYVYNDSAGIGFLTNGGAWAAYVPLGTNNWQVNGSMTASGNVTAYSDERVKANWRTLDDGFVVKLASVKSGIYDRTDIEITQAGVSAQSLRQVLPESVIESDDGDLSVAYGNAAMVSAVELAKELVALKHKVTELEARIH